MAETKPSEKTILVVDDDATMRELFELFLRREGFKVIPAEDGRAAWKKLKAHEKQKIHLVILDLMMPEEGGFGVLKKMQHPDYADIPIFVVTARDLDEETMKIVRSESNVKGFFNKPVVHDEIMKKIHQELKTQPL